MEQRAEEIALRLPPELMDQVEASDLLGTIAEEGGEEEVRELVAKLIDALISDNEVLQERFEATGISVAHLDSLSPERGVSY